MISTLLLLFLLRQDDSPSFVAFGFHGLWMGIYPWHQNRLPTIHHSCTIGNIGYNSSVCITSPQTPQAYEEFLEDVLSKCEERNLVINVHCIMTYFEDAVLRAVRAVLGTMVKARAVSITLHSPLGGRSNS